MLRIAVQLVLFLGLALPALAEDWVADRLRGTVEIKTSSGWTQLVRGTPVLNGQSVRTGADGRVDLVRGEERVSMEPGTIILLHEGEGKLTSIEQSSGMVTAEVEVQDVQHFSVQTPFLAAVVKGTRFRVVVGGGNSRVTVERGTVQVQDTINDLVVDIVRGQEASVGQDQPLEVSGGGTIAIYTFDGKPVVNGTTDVQSSAQGQPSENVEGTGAGSNNGNGNGGQGNNGNGNGGQGNNGNGNSGQGNNGNNNGNSGQGNNGNGNSGQGNNGNNNGNSGQGNNGNGNGGQGNNDDD